MTKATTDDYDDDPSIAWGPHTVAIAYEKNGVDRLATVAAPSPDATTSARFANVDLPNVKSVSANGWAPAVAIGADDKPIVAFHTDYAENGGPRYFAVWKQGGKPVVLFNSGSSEQDGGAAGLAIQGDHVVAITDLSNTEADDAPVVHVFTSDDGGETFANGVSLKGDKVSAPFSLPVAITPNGKGAFAYYPNSSTGNNKCMRVKVSMASDLSTWSTCTRLAGFDPPKSFQSNYFPAVVVGPRGTLWAIFASTDATEVTAGILAWKLP